MIRKLMGDGFAVDMENVDEWKPTPAQAREAIFSRLIVAPGAVSPESQVYAPSFNEVTVTADMSLDAIRNGRFIDFGFWPNDVIKDCGKRGGPMYQRGAFVMPFRKPWLLMHSWEQATAVYLINQLDEHKSSGADFEAVELMCGKYSGVGVFAIGDRVWLTTDDSVRVDDQYCVHTAPCVWRFIPGARDTFNNGGSPEQAAVGNVLDPIMTGLLILSTLGVRRETVKADDKLNRARVKSGKQPIPPYDRVYSEEYVTALSNRGTRQRGDDKGGHHASPQPHVRRGHMRTYKSGRVALIHDTLVRVSEEARAAFKAGRTHYTVAPPTEL